MRISPNGERYIGQTSFKEEERWRRHCLLAYNESLKDYNYPLSKAIRKYGPDNFTCEILEDNINDTKTLHEREMYWIEYYDTYNNGLNATLGGSGTKRLNTEQIKALWDAGMCVRDICVALNITSKTALAHLNMTSKECGQRGPVYKTKNSIKFFGDYQTGRAMPVSCYNMKTGKLVRSFSSAYEAAQYLNLYSSTSILRAVSGILHSAYGYLWRKGTAKKLSKEELPNSKPPQENKNKPVVCVETNMMYINVRTAQLLTGICYKSIVHVCKGHQHTAGNMHWRYATDDDQKTLTMLGGERRKARNARARSVQCLETGKKYDSITQAVQDTGISDYHIKQCCLHPELEFNNTHWTFIT